MEIAGPSRLQPAKVTPPQMPGLNSLLALATGVVIVAALSLAREILIPITLAVLLSFVLAPLVELLRRIYVPQVLSVIVAVVIGLSAIGALGGIIGVQVASLAPNVPRYASTLENKMRVLQGLTQGSVSGLAELLRQSKRNATAVSSSMEPAATQTRNPKPIPVEVQEPSSDPLTMARNILEPILAPFQSAIIIFIVAVFILLQKEDLRDRMIRLFGSTDLHRTTLAMDEAGRRLSRYFLAQVCINTIFGVVIGIGLALIGLPNPLLWGVLTAILRFVPYIGAFIAAALPVALAAAISPNWSSVAWTLGLFVISESITGQIIEPMIYGHSTGLSPVAVVIAAIFWTWLWGPIGLILSTPSTLCLVVLGRYVDRLEFLDVLLGDRPALTPVENFYQRMLADDPDEALQQAELLLKERTLANYYDEVALRGLQLAANDAQRGVLTVEKVQRIKESVNSLIEDLAGHEDREPNPDEKLEAEAIESKAEREARDQPVSLAPIPAIEDLPPQWRSEAPVLCLAGRGPVDDSAASILAQLLEKHGLGARPEPYEAASRENIRRLSVEGIALVCICHIGINSSPAALHYLIRRLRLRLPEASILVGLWPLEAATLKDDRIRSVIGADHYASSLRETLEICTQLASQIVLETSDDLLKSVQNF
jgi:predicted PurR-regulated permease PerM